MNRPKLITYNFTSVDGRLTLAPDVLLLFGDPRWQLVSPLGDEDPYAALMADFQPQAILEGSGSFVLPSQPSEPLPAVEGDPAALYQDHLPDEIVNQPGRRWFTITDSGGRVRWMYKEFTGETWAGWYLLVLVSRATQPEYLAYLRRESIPYLVAGDGLVDLPAALEKLHSRLGVETIVSTGGGRLNGALLRQGLVDEVVVEVCPALIGGTHTPALFTAPDLLPEQNPVQLELVSCQPAARGTVRLHYRIRKEAA